MSVAAVPCAPVVDESRDSVWPSTEHSAYEFFEEVDDERFFVAASPLMCRIRRQLQDLATINLPVLVVGESGTGKDVVATLLHRLSARRNGALIRVNCAAIPSELLESELFGYENGAFTGATHRKPGKFELSDHGTILLDEIAEMPPAAQAKLLHVLQDNNV